MTPHASFAPLVERYFGQRLITQKQASAHTIASYRDTFRLFLRFTRKQTGKSPSDLEFSDIDVDLIEAFLTDLEKCRGISARSRNLRLSALRSFFRFALYFEPAHAGRIQQILAIPAKRHDRTLVGFLTRSEVESLLAVPDCRTWNGRRDHALLLVAFQTGMRLSEITGLRRHDVQLDTGAHVRCFGKGRKERCTPLAVKTVKELKAWMKEPVRGDSDFLFPTVHGRRMSADAVQCLLAKYAAIARQTCFSLRSKRVSPHVARHYFSWPTMSSSHAKTL
ncbi:MAG: tyrosine-type recombinase/integrase [Steroidobacteraceae bacterium]